MEVLTYVNVVAGAGNDTTTRLIGWRGKVLADHPDQRRDLVENRSLVPNAIEELLGTSPRAPRGPLHDPGGRAAWPDGARGQRDALHRRRPTGTTAATPTATASTFAGTACAPHVRPRHPLRLGAALARLEGRVALDEVLQRFPEWDVDLDNARLAPTSTLRGWETLPVVTR